jgi:hypothetical protein
MFNFEGRTRIHTVPGVTCSLVLYVAYLALVFDRTASFLDRSSSTVTENIHSNVWSSEADGFNWTEKNFTMAVGVQNYHTKEFKNNDAYVEWEVHV